MIFPEIGRISILECGVCAVRDDGGGKRLKRLKRIKRINGFAFMKRGF